MMKRKKTVTMKKMRKVMMTMMVLRMRKIQMRRKKKNLRMNLPLLLRRKFR